MSNDNTRATADEAAATASPEARWSALAAAWRSVAEQTLVALAQVQYETLEPLEAARRVKALATPCFELRDSLLLLAEPPSPRLLVSLDYWMVTAMQGVDWTREAYESVVSVRQASDNLTGLIQRGLDMDQEWHTHEEMRSLAAVSPNPWVEQSAQWAELANAAVRLLASRQRTPHEDTDLDQLRRQVRACSLSARGLLAVERTGLLGTPAHHRPAAPPMATPPNAPINVPANSIPQR